MPVPRRRRSRTRQGNVRSQKNMPVPGVAKCESCGSAKRAHHICPSCGTYKKRTYVVKVTQ